MKPLQFTIPVAPDKSVIVQEDILTHFYPHLHRHKEVQLVWIIKGKGTLIVESNMYSFREGDIFYLSSNLSHVFKNDKQKGKVHSLALLFDIEKWQQGFSFFPETKKIQQFLNNCTGGFKIPDKKKEAIGEQIFQVKKAKEQDRFIFFIRLLKELSSLKTIPLASGTISSISEGEGIRMRNIYNYVFAHYDATITLDEAAAVANLTTPAFCRYFKKHTRVTFLHFLNEVRINEAKKKLAEGNGSISAVAYQCGFNSIATFNRVFKLFTGITPGNFVKFYLEKVN